MGKLTIEILPIFSDNYVYLLRDAARGVTGVVDPGDAAPVLARLGETGWKLDWILSTHHHQDHTGGNLEIKRRTGCRIAGPAGERDAIPGIDLELREGDRFELGDASAAVLETPGHTRGHISYWFEDDGALFCADTLFALGCGRVFEGTPPQMWASLSKLAALPGPTRDLLRPRVHAVERALRADGRSRERGAPAPRRGDRAAARGGTADHPFDARRGARDQPVPARRRLPDPPRPRLADASDAEVFAEIRRRKDRF